MKKHIIAYSVVVLFNLACAKKDAASVPAYLPLVTPPVKAATPVALRGTTRSLDPTEFRSRFFTTGPTAIFNILTDIDSRITGINTRAASSTAACLTQTPVAYTITPWGQSITMYGQCYENVGTPTASDPLLVQWGKKDGVTYLYTAIGASWVAAIATPNGTTPETYQVRAWVGVGYSNASCGAGAWDTCSYGVMQIEANSQTLTFEMTVAGIGFGYCGARLKSDGTNVYSEGSADGPGCAAIDTLCGTAADLATAGTCGTALTTASPTMPSLGRMSQPASAAATTQTGVTTHAASAYPASPTVLLDGTATDALRFGPTTPSTGVGAF